MPKNKAGLVLSHIPKPTGVPLWLSVLVVGVCAISDGLTIYIFSAELFNEVAAISILISAVMACGLDFSMLVLGKILSTGRPDNQEALFRRKMAIIGLVTAFGLSFLALVLLAAAVSWRDETNMLTDATVARLLVPLITSIISLFSSLCMDPVAQRRACLDRQIAETWKEKDRLDAQIDLLEQGLRMFDPGRMDYLMEKAARLKIEILREQAYQTLCEEMEKRLDDQEASKKIRQQIIQRAEHIAAIEAELHELLENTDLAPVPKSQSPIRIVEDQEEQAPVLAEAN